MSNLDCEPGGFAPQIVHANVRGPGTDEQSDLQSHLILVLGLLDWARMAKK
jgi:hypothetical protein